MAKTETKTRGSYKCGKCGDTGHNARKCGKAGATTIQPTPTTPTTPVVETVEAKPADVKPLPPPLLVAMSQTQDLTDLGKQDKTPTAIASPFSCPSCNRVGILVLLQLENAKKRLCCEHCYTKVTAKTILKWGARPSDKPADAPPPPKFF